MTWTVTYRTGGYRNGIEQSETLDAAWCKGTFTNPAAISTPEQALWHLALLLGDHGQTDAELIRIEEAG